MSFYFFADIDNLNIQNSDGFGPAANATIDNVDYEQFLVTSKHTASNHINAIAVCRGQIFVQEQSANADLLNIVFKPIDTQPFNFPKIKYFIYKGIRKDSLIAQNNIDLAILGTNDLIDSIWASFQKFNQTGNPSKAVLGLQADLNALIDSTLLEQVFSSTYANVQFWNVQAGDALGKFDKDSIGFEIVLDTLFYKPTLELCRNSETYIKVKSLATSPLHKDFFEHWHDKEAITNFIDPCAFFGGFYDDKLSVSTGSSKSRWKGEDLYTNLLTKFLNKNKCYIDIRNEFNFSLNYFKNYGASPTDNLTNIKVKKGAAALATTLDYYSSNWPLLVLDNTGFGTNNTDYQIVTLQLTSGNGDNPAPILYFSKAFVPNSNFPEEYMKIERFKPLTVTDNFCAEFSIGLPSVNSNLVSSYVQLKYCKQTTEDVLPDPISTQIRRTNICDCIFSPVMNFNHLSSPLKTRVFNDTTYLDLRKSQNYDGVFVPGISFDAQQVTLFAIVNNYHKNSTRRKVLPLEVAGEFKSNTNEDVFLSGLIQRYSEKPLTDVGEDIILNLELTEWNPIVSSNEFLSKYPVFLSMGNQRLEVINNQQYNVTDCILIGYKVEGNNIQISSYNTNISAYNLVSEQPLINI
jgi:hypothetical protein